MQWQTPFGMKSQKNKHVRAGEVSVYFDFAFCFGAVLGCIDICSAFLSSGDDAFVCDGCHRLVAAGKCGSVAGGDFGSQRGRFAHRQREGCFVQGNLRGCHGDGADLRDAV